ncbi:MAG: DUF2314 domain-containing protein [Rariglobus sp.]
MKRPLLLLSVLVLLAGCSKRPETLVDSYDQVEMNAAIAKAKGSVDEFIAVLDAQGADSFSVKAPITDANGTEHFWITDVSFKDGVFAGKIGNEPGIVKNVRIGQDWRVNKADISDWMFMRGEKIHGGYTIDPLLPGFPKGQADAMRSRLVR